MKQKLCTKVYEFFKDKCDIINEDPKRLEFKDWDDMLTQIKSDFRVALWAITELPFWYMPEEYEESIRAGYNEEDEIVYKLDDMYFITTDGDNITFVKPVTTLVEVTTWVPRTETDAMQDTIDELFRQQGGIKV
jgi:hypothetical protein